MKILASKIKRVDKVVKIMAVAGSLRVNLLRFTRNGVHSHDLVRLVNPSNLDRRSITLNAFFLFANLDHRSITLNKRP